MFPNPVHLANSNLFPNYFKTTAVLIRLSSSFVSPLAALHAGMAPVTHTGPHSGFKAKTRTAGLLWTRGDSSVLFCLFCSDRILSLLISFIALQFIARHDTQHTSYVSSMASGTAMAVGWFGYFLKISHELWFRHSWFPSRRIIPCANTS